MTALRAFEAAARNASFTEAGQELCVSQSAISHQVRSLEKALGADLFVRDARSIALTRAGRAYYPILREAFDRIAEGAALMSGTSAADPVILQVYSTFAIRWLIPRLPDLQSKYPDLRVRLHTSQSDVDFEHDDVDLCVMIGRPSRADLRYDYLFSSRVFPVCSPEFCERLQLWDYPERLRDAPLLQVYPSKKDWWVWLQQQELSGIDPDAGQQFDSYELAINAAVRGLGIGLGIEPFVTRELALGLLVEPFPGSRVEHPDDWYLVCRENHAERTGIAAFRQWITVAVENDGDLVLDVDRGTGPGAS